jgi:hypothetical protein
MADLEEIVPLADKARSKYAITFPTEVVDCILDIRLSEREDLNYKIYKLDPVTKLKVDYGLLLGACKAAHNQTGWRLGITTIYESLQILDVAQKNAEQHRIQKEIDRALFRIFMWEWEEKES